MKQMILSPAKKQSQSQDFWGQALALQGSATPRVLVNLLIFGFIALGVTAAHHMGLNLSLEIGPLEVWGAVIGLMLVMRTNSGYDRWWEARKLWGGIVNQCRNLVISSFAYGPQDQEWRQAVKNWAIAFPYVARSSLRGKRDIPELEFILGSTEAQKVLASNHMPSYVVYQLSLLLRSAQVNNKMDSFGFMQVDKERAQLIDHIGGCERILKTPLPLVYAIKIRRFLMLYLVLLPLGLVDQIEWLTPVATMIIAYPILSLDQIGVELQNPFSEENLSHLPLDTISLTIEENIKGLYEVQMPTEIRSRILNN